MDLRVLCLEEFEDDVALAGELRNRGLGLKPSEARKIHDILGRDPNQVELCIFGTQWSEHCSYKSSRRLLREYLPTEGPEVILGPKEDSGILLLCTHEGVRYGLVISHESHNHPSQVLPVEGAATGIGGIVRDINCMGADIIAVADPLRFGDPNGRNAERTRGIVEGVVDGIWQYGNALGVPNLGGDVVFDKGFDDNCLVNVVSLGILREEDIIHSAVPPEAHGKDYVLVLVGKPTDWSGFGGATFASEILDEADEEANKGAVQIPDPFLKNVLSMNKANAAVMRRIRERKIPVGFKDLGAGGIVCVSSELGAAGDVGVTVDLDAVHVAEEDIPSEVICCAETQERFMWVLPRDFAEEVLKIYNEEWELPHIYEGAGARIVGEVRDDDRYVVTHRGEIVCDASIHGVTTGISYDRESRAVAGTLGEPDFPEPEDLNRVLLDLLGSPNLCSREYIYRFYDTEVQGNAVIRPGEADAGVTAPLPGCPVGVALSVDGNPFYGALSPFHGGATAVAEAMRNVAAVGARPLGLTDCLNYGNPEIPEAFWAFEEGVKGVAEAARSLSREDPAIPIPIVSGNVSFYNQSATGKAIPPSPIICCVGVLDDYSTAVTMELKKPGNLLLLVGERYPELGGSEYARVIHGHPGGAPPIVRYPEERGIIYGTVEAIQKGLAVSAHDISAGGMAVSVAEMCFQGDGGLGLGVACSLKCCPIEARIDHVLFSESSGMLLEVPVENLAAIEAIYAKYDLKVHQVGVVREDPRLGLTDRQGRQVFDLGIEEMRRRWSGGLRKALFGAEN